MKLNRGIFIVLVMALWASLSACTAATRMRGDSATPDEKAKKSKEHEKISDVSEADIEREAEKEAESSPSVIEKSEPAMVKIILVKGKVRDALNAKGIAGADISILSPAGEPVSKLFHSRPEGDFHIPDLPPGAYKVKVAATGYIETVQDFTIVANEEQTVDVLLSTVLAEETFRAVLTWGQAPQDLDAHVKIIDVATGLVKSDVYYDNYTFEDANAKVSLDIDNVDGFGPETITFAAFVPGKYKLQFVVNNYNGVKGAKGNIKVQLFKGRAMLATYTLPANNPGLTGYWNWSAFEIDAAGKVVPVQAFAAPFAYDADPLVNRQQR